MLGLKKALWAPLVAGTLICFDHSAANAAVVINVVESGSDVIFSYTGQLDLTGLGVSGSYGNGGGGYLVPSSGQFSPGVGNYDIYSLSPLTSFGSGSYTPSTSDTGVSKFGLIDLMGTYLAVPQGYTSNSSLSGGSTYSSSTFSSLGLTTGTYTTSLPSDTITMNIGVAPVPAPLPLLGLGAAAAFSRKLKQRIALRRKVEVVGEAA